jgi:hypothetical protein
MGTRTSGYVYLLHFNTALVGGGHQSRHYVGWARNWVYRVQAHRRGTSHARIMEVLWERGYTFEVAVVVKGSQALERQIKRAHHHSRYCPLCGSTRLTDYRSELAQ